MSMIPGIRILVRILVRINASKTCQKIEEVLLSVQNAVRVYNDFIEMKINAAI